MSYSTDLIKAKDGWWVVIKNLPPDKDFPDPIQPHPFTDAVKQMDGLMYRSYCYKSEGLFGMNVAKAQKEFYEITNSDDVTKFLQYWAALAAKVKEDKDAGKGAIWGLCLLGMLGDIPTTKRYVAAYLSKNLNLKYSLVVLATEGVHQKYNAGEHTNLFKELFDIIKPDSSLAGDWKKTAQLAVMSLAFAYPGTEMNNDSWVNFMAAIRKKQVPQYCLLEGEVEKPDPPPPPKPGGGFPWLIVILVVLAVYMLYYYNKNS